MIELKNISKTYGTQLILENISFTAKSKSLVSILGPSGSGKSNWITNLIHLFSIGRGTFAYIHIICKDVTEPLYKFLASKSDQISVKEGLHNLPDLEKMDK